MKKRKRKGGREKLKSLSTLADRKNKAKEANVRIVLDSLLEIAFSKIG